MLHLIEAIEQKYKTAELIELLEKSVAVTWCGVEMGEVPS